MDVRVRGGGAEPENAESWRLIPLRPDERIERLAETLDIGAAALAATPRHSWDLELTDISSLLGSVARHAASRGLQPYLQLPGRCLPLAEESLAQRRADIADRPRFRLLVTAGGRTVENIAVELWKQTERAYRSLSDENAVRLLIPGLSPSARGPARIEGSFDEPVDVVYTWVDGSDPGWRAMAAGYMDLDALEADLYAAHDDLRYSLRSVEAFAPWVNRVHILSNCAPPAWFEPSDRVRWVDHGDVADAKILPLFSSDAIETLLHRIEDLSEHFVYLNDDFMLWDSVTPATFFEWEGRSIARLATNSSVLYLQQLVEAGTATATQHSRVNAARLLEQHIGVFHTRVHGHVPYALRRSHLAALLEAFQPEVDAMRAAHTRQPDEVAVIPYLYHHYGHAKGWVSYADAPRSFVTLQNYRRRGSADALRSAAFVCFQDSRGSGTDDRYQAFKRRTLEAALPLPSRAERHGDAPIPNSR